MTSAHTWRTDLPTRSGWFVSDGDLDLMRYYHAERGWSAPVHVDDLEQIGERVRCMPAEASDEPIAWADA